MALLTMLRCKLHVARVTEANVEYEGSLTLDPDLREAAGLKIYEKILVANFSNGKRFETYVIEGERGSGEVCLNGGTAHLGAVGDKLMIAAFAQLSEQEAETHRPTIVLLNQDNTIKSVSHEIVAHSVVESH